MHKISGDKVQMLTEFKATVAWCWDVECSSRGRSLVGPLSWLGALCLYNSCCKTNTECHFHLLPFFIKAKSSWDFFWLVKILTNVSLSWKQNGINKTFEKPRIRVLLTKHCSYWWRVVTVCSSRPRDPAFHPLHWSRSPKGNLLRYIPQWHSQRREVNLLHLT